MLNNFSFPSSPSVTLSSLFDGEGVHAFLSPSPFFPKTNIWHCIFCESRVAAMWTRSAVARAGWVSARNGIKFTSRTLNATPCPGTFFNISQKKIIISIGKKKKFLGTHSAHSSDSEIPHTQHYISTYNRNMEQYQERVHFLSKLADNAFRRNSFPTCHFIYLAHKKLVSVDGNAFLS